MQSKTELQTLNLELWCFQFFYFKCACKSNIVLFYTQITDTCKDNWTPRHTGKGNVFECFLACRSGQRVQCAF